MAQNFRRYTAKNVGTSAVSLKTSTTNDTLTSLVVANTTANEINVSAYINDGSNNIYIGKEVPIPANSSVDFIMGKILMESGDELFVVSSTSNSADIWCSTVDNISS